MRKILNPFTKKLQFIPGFDFNYVTDRYYQSAFYGTGGAAVALGSGILFLFPMTVLKDGGFKALTQQVTVAVNGAKMRCGLYKDQGGVWDSPIKDLVVDAGEQTFSGTGAQTYEQVIDQYIREEQPLWGAVIMDNGMTLNTYGTNPYGIRRGDADPTSVRPINHYRVTRAYGALPSTITPNQSTEISRNQCPYLLLKSK